VIRSWRDPWLREFFEKDTHARKLPSEIRERVFRKMQMLDDAADENDLRVPPSNHFEKLRGRLAGWCSIRVNERWRLIFRWQDGEADGVYLDDHSYR
jgi:toxin HigB-1